MMRDIPKDIDQSVEPRTRELFLGHRMKIFKQTDRLFVGLMIFQWIVGIVFALVVSPKTWAGSVSQTHFHVWTAIFLGGAIAIVPIFFGIFRSGEVITRNVIAIAQMLYSALLIHLTGGRIETHFHVFGSLAFLAFYRDWPIFIPATIVVAVDHMLRGIFWPQSVFGVLTVSPFRWIEHAAWVIFEDLFLIASCRRGVMEMWQIAERTAQLEANNQQVEVKIKERTQELHESEERVRSIVQTANDAFVSIDEEGLIIDWNRSAERIFGWPHSEIIGKNLRETIIPHQYREAHRQGLNHFLKTGQGPVLGKNLELTALHRNGREFAIEITIWPIQVGSKYQFNAFIRDISERKKTEIQLKTAFTNLQKIHEDLKQTQTQLLQSEKLASIGQLAAGVAHEINNPIGFISNNMEMLEQYIAEYAKVLRMVEILQKNVEEGNIEKAQALARQMTQFEQEIDLNHTIDDAGKLLEHNQRGLERVRKIVLDLKTFTRGGNDTMETVRVEEIIDSILSIVHNELKYKAELKKNYGDTPFVKANPQRLGQVFVNLLVNAGQAIEGKGIIEVETYKHDGHVCVNIRDTGKGISPQDLPKIFDPFFTTKPVGQGTGLGLSVTYEIIKKHGGEIKVQSKVGEGTTFTVMLPIASAEAKRI